MLQAFFNGLAGLFSFSQGLNNVSDNVSNMNTPGFRGSDTFYRSVSGDGEDGLGSRVAGTEVRTKAGDNRQTSNTNDAAISGNGYFVLKDAKGEYAYTRAGQFAVDQNGYLVESVSQSRVQQMSSSGTLQDIKVTANQTLAPIATTSVQMSGALARSGTTEGTDTLSSIVVYDAAGTKHTLTMVLNPQSSPSNSWSVSISDEQGLLQTGTIAFGSDGTPMAGFNQITLALRDGAQQITFDFGTPGSFNLASQVASAANHTLTAKVVDGSPSSSLSSFGYDAKGVIQLQYANGQTRDGAQLALASFNDATQLIASNSLYRTPPNMKAEYGVAGTRQFGDIQGGYLEGSNVDLSQEFGDILIIQRGYQASSRVMTVSNELLEQLYNGTKEG